MRTRARRPTHCLAVQPASCTELQAALAVLALPPVVPAAARVAWASVIRELIMPVVLMPTPAVTVCTAAPSRRLPTLLLLVTAAAQLPAVAGSRSWRIGPRADWPAEPRNRVLVCMARTLNATAQSRVTPYRCGQST